MQTLPTDQRRKGEGRTFTARRVVLAAGTYGTQTLLHRMKAGGQLPYLSQRLGELTRTNSEALVGAQTDDRRYRRAHGTGRADFTRGVAITSSIHPDENTHIEPVRYGKGSNAMGGLSILQVPYAQGSSRVAGWLANAARHPLLAAPVAVQPPLVRADHHRPGHAVARQLPDDVPEAERPGQGAADGTSGPRRAQPQADRGGHAGRHGPRRGDQRLRGQQRRRADGHAAHRALPRRLPDRRGRRRTGVIDPYHRLYGHPGISVVDGVGGLRQPRASTRR